jgi:hypothetical protein
MAHVYGDADCTIAYLLPPEDMFTKPRQDPRIWSPCIFRPPSLASRGAYIRPIIFDEMVRYDGIDWLSPKDWPLFTRAWVCQEYLLSPRIVFAGHRNLIWECSELLCDELLGPLDAFHEARASKTHFSAVRSVELPVMTIATELRFVQDWGKLVRHYRAGVLTQPKDRIMAFAGIAQAVHDSSGMVYLAGSWAQMFPFSFTWSVAGTPERNMVTEVVPVIEAVPSWSWFSVPISSHDELEFEIVEESLKRLLPMYGMTIPLYKATLLSFDRSQEACADPSPTKAFHNFAGMTLNLAMKTWTGFLENSRNPDSRDGRTIKDQFERLMGRSYVHFTCKFDHRDARYNHSDNIMTFGLLIELRRGRDTQLRSPDGPFLVGLLMQPEPSRETYKRIGLWTMYLRRLPIGWDLRTFNSVSIFDQLQGVRSEHIRLA